MAQQPKHQKFLEFNGKSISFLSIDGTYWVAIKPICEALGVQYERQFKNIKEDEILSQLLSEQTMVAADGKLRQMVCLPEKWVYGWIFSIRSESADLKQYKLTCYEILFEHFHGMTSKRLTALREKSQAELDIERLDAKLKQTEEYKALEAAKLRKSLATRMASKLDADAVQQLDLFDTPEEPAPTDN